MQAIGMSVGDIGIRAFNAPGQVCADEQIQDPVNAVGRNPSPLRLRHRLGNVICRCWLIETRQCRENLGAHRRPLLTGSLQRGLRGDGKRNAFMFMMLVATHRAYLSFYRPSGKLGTQPDSVRGPAVEIMPQREQANAHQREQRLATAIMR